jgi:glutathione S-transferase
MALVNLVIALALVEFVVFGIAVSRARSAYRVHAPAMSGHEVFDRYFRAHMNTLEQLVVFVPSILLFATYADARVAAALGALFVVARAFYFVGYVRAAEARHVPFILGVVPSAILLVGGLIGALRAIVHSYF